MSQRAPVALEEEGQVRLAVHVAGGGDGTAVAGERIPRQTDETWLLAAVSGEGGERTAVEAIDTLRSAVSGANNSDTGALLKQTYRRLNTIFYQQGMGRQTASAVSMVANGKYATIAQIGTGRAYLLRAGRLNQITRDIAPVPLRTGKQREEPADQPKPLLGARERLDSRQPSVYEITLLADDRLLLCTEEVYQANDDAQLTSGLATSPETALATIPAGAAVVALVAAARERAPIVISTEAKQSALPLIAAIVLILVLILGALAYATFF